MQVKFADEQGVDEGGPSREFLQLVVRECFSPNFGMFQCDPDSRTFWMRASDIHQMLDEFELIGMPPLPLVTTARVIEYPVFRDFCDLKRVNTTLQHWVDP